MADSPHPSTTETFQLRILMPDNHQVRMTFLATDTVWAAKQKLFGNSIKVLHDSQNYGLYIPACNGRSGKFLDDERMLKEYQLTVPELLLKYKQRSNPSITPMKLKKINTPSNQRDFMELVKRNEVERVDRTLTKGFEPNFNIADETPLTASCSLARPRSMMITLVSGGAFLDYRNKRGQTPLHVAVSNENKEAVRVLLDLGCSPNYKDKDNLTPLFYCTTCNKNVHCLNMLLHDRAEVDCRDAEWWTELHHACKEGKSAIAERLIFYGSDINTGTKDGNTPLHICAKFNQEAICKILLKRGADKMMKNNSGMMASDIAVINKHNDIYNFINSFSASEIVFFTDMPTYNEKRRGTLSLSTMKNIARSRSIPNINSLFSDAVDPSSTISNSSLNNFQSNGFHPKPPPTKERVSAIDLDWRGEAKKDSGFVEIPTNYEGYEEHVFILHKTGNAVFGFTLKGTNDSSEPNNTFKSTTKTPARNFIAGVEIGKLADEVGIKDGDFLLEINGTNVSEQPHSFCVESIVKSDKILRLKILRKTKILNLKGVNETSSSIEASINKELQATLDNFDQILTSSPSTIHGVNGTSSDGMKIKSNETSNQSNSSIPVPPPLPPMESLGRDCHKSMTSLSIYQESYDNNAGSSKPGTVRSSMGIFPDAAHDDLLEAVRKRRQMVESSDQNKLSESIENRIGKTKKIRGNIPATTTSTTNNNNNNNLIYSNLTKTNVQSTNHLATEAKTLPKSFKKTLGDLTKRSSLGDNLNSKAEEDGGDEVVQSKTLPKKPSDLLNTSNEGDFLAVAEMLRQNFIKKKQHNLNGSQFSINSNNSNGKQPSDVSDEVDQASDKQPRMNSEPFKFNESISHAVELSPPENQNVSKLEEKSINIPTFEDSKPFNHYGQSAMTSGMIDFKPKNRPAPPPPKKPSVNQPQQSVEQPSQHAQISTPEQIERSFIEAMEPKTPVVQSPSSAAPTTGNGNGSANNSIPPSPLSFSDLALMVAVKAAQMHKASEEKGVPMVPEHQTTGTTKRYVHSSDVKRLNSEQPKSIEASNYLSNKKVFVTSSTPATTATTTSSNRKVFSTDGSSVSEMTKLFTSSNSHSKHKPQNLQFKKPTSPRSNSQDRIFTFKNDKLSPGKLVNSNQMPLSTSTNTINSVVGTPSSKEKLIKYLPVIPPPKEFTSNYDSKINGGVSTLKTNGTSDPPNKTTIFNSTNVVPQSVSSDQPPVSPDKGFPVLRKTSHASSNTMIFKAKVGNSSQQKKS